MFADKYPFIFPQRMETTVYFTSGFTGHTLCQTYPNVHFCSTIRLSFKELRRCIRRTATPGLEMFSFLEYVTESKIWENEEITVFYWWFKVILQYCNAHPLLRTILHVISARTLENGGFFLYAGPRHRSKSSFLRKRVWWPIIVFCFFELNNKFLYVK